MRLELPARPGTRVFGRLTPRASPRRGEIAAVAVLISLAVLAFGVPALLGHSVLPGDDLTQNYPLRALAGSQLRHGQLPLYNPYIWSGAPLLAGWNAGAAYPLTFLFAIVAPAAAWALNMVATWSVAAAGMFFFLRALRLATLPSFLGALSFAFAGAMPAQVAHFGLVAGMSWVPVGLLAVLRLSQAQGTAARLRWTAVLAAAMGLTILAGEPRAVDDAYVIVAGYAAWCIARLGRRGGPAAGFTAGGLVLGACLGAVQWLPGLAIIGTSQRGAGSAAFFNSGSLPHRWLLLMLVPDLLGGSGSFGQPGYFANYNLAEVTGYAGLFPLVAATALLARVRLRPRPPEWLVWHLMALVGVVLALGGNTPAGHLLVHIPLFSGQRLQSRNILVTDLALAVLLGYWADRPFGATSQAPGVRLPGRILGRLRTDRETVLALVPPLAVITVATLGFVWGPGFLHWLRAGAGAAEAGRLKPWLVPYALMGAAAAAFVLAGRGLGPKSRSRWLGALVVTDVVVFALLAVVAVAPGLGASRPVAPGHAAPPAALAGQILSGQHQARGADRTRPAGALGYPGRFAIYDPDEIASRELPLLGSPDLNAMWGTPSVQGYSSLVDGRYAAATGSHQAMGEGQDVLAPRAVADGVLGQLDTSVLFTVPAYLITSPAAAGPAPGPAGTGRRDLAAGHQATWYFGTPLDVSRLTIPDPAARADAAAGAAAGLVLGNGATRWFRVGAAGASLLAARLPHPVMAIGVTGRAGTGPCRLGPPAMTAPNGSVFVANGQLQDALTPPRWGTAGHDGPFAVFTDRFARGPLSLEPLAGRSASGATVRALAGPAAGPTAAAVSSPRGARLVRAVAAIPGWSATWRPRDGAPASSLAVRRAGLVQAVDVPPGRGIVTWSYTPPGFTAGAALSGGAAALIIVLLIMSRRRPARPAPAAGEVSEGPGNGPRT